MDWKELRAEIKEKWRRLTDRDLGGSADRFEQIGGKIEPRYAMARAVSRKHNGDRQKTLR